jgi:hypothetical protein
MEGPGPAPRVLLVKALPQSKVRWNFTWAAGNRRLGPAIISMAGPRPRAKASRENIPPGVSRHGG